MRAAYARHTEAGIARRRNQERASEPQAALIEAIKPVEQPVEPQTMPFETAQIIEFVAPRTPVKAIIREVAKRRGVLLYDIIGPCRTRSAVAARYEAMREVHARRPDQSFSQIAMAFNKDHSTVLYALGRLKRKSGH